MTRVFLTGDTHRNLDIDKLSEGNFPIQKELTREDYLIVLGDFGAVWDGHGDDHWLDWWESKPYTTLFIDGNHENFTLLNKYPKEHKLGGLVGVIRPHVWHLLRGETYKIGDNDFWCFGGAGSTDKELRTPYRSWWPQEIPTQEEQEHGIDSMCKINYKPEYILTHDCPESCISELEQLAGYGLEPLDAWEDNLRQYLETIRKDSQYVGWYFGHYHLDAGLDNNMNVLYNMIVEIK